MLVSLEEHENVKILVGQSGSLVSEDVFSDGEKSLHRSTGGHSCIVLNEELNKGSLSQKARITV